MGAALGWLRTRPPDRAQPRVLRCRPGRCLCFAASIDGNDFFLSNPVGGAVCAPSGGLLQTELEEVVESLTG